MSKEVRPEKISIEASSICQLGCPSCPNTSKATQSVIGSGFLKFYHFKTILDENQWIKEIELSNYGEIFLNPDLLGIIKYANARNVALRADNGVNLNTVEDDVLEGLVRHKFRSLTCSIDGASSETYGKYRVKGDFEVVIENIRKINDFKVNYRSKCPALMWQFIIFGHNEHEIFKARALAKELGMRFQLKLPWDAEFSPVRNEQLVRKEAGYVSREEYRQKCGVDYMQNICRDLWDQPQINWDGKLLGCSRNFWGDFGGNVFNDGLAASLNNEKMEYARGMLIGKMEPGEDIPCSTCSIYLDKRAGGRYLNRSLLCRAARSAYKETRLNRYRMQMQKLHRFIP